MKQKTALQEFLEHVIQKEFETSVSLKPAITKEEINKAIEKERQQILDAFVAGDERGTGETPFNCEQYYSQNFYHNG